VLTVGNEEPKRINRNIMVDKKIDSIMEELRIRNKDSDSEITISRSDIWNVVAAAGIPIYKLQLEYGQQEYQRVMNLLNKLDLKKVDIEKIL
jgi:hypothetical protein